VDDGMTASGGSGQAWTVEHVEAVSLAWEAATGYDSIPTIERIYDRAQSGAIECAYPDCDFRRHDAEAMWRHVHTGHGNDSMPPPDFDYGWWF
jgi:hypothetical protein